MAVQVNVDIRRIPIEDPRFPNLAYRLFGKAKIPHDATGGSASVQFQVYSAASSVPQYGVLLTRFNAVGKTADPARFNLAVVSADFELAVDGNDPIYGEHLVSAPTILTTGDYVHYYMDTHKEAGHYSLPAYLGRVVSNYGRIYATSLNVDTSDVVYTLEGYLLAHAPSCIELPYL